MLLPRRGLRWRARGRAVRRGNIADGWTVGGETPPPLPTPQRRGWTCPYGCPGRVVIRAGLTLEDTVEHVWDCPWWEGEGVGRTPF